MDITSFSLRPTVPATPRGRRVRKWGAGRGSGDSSPGHVARNHVRAPHGRLRGEFRARRLETELLDSSWACSFSQSLPIAPAPRRPSSPRYALLTPSDTTLRHLCAPTSRPSTQRSAWLSGLRIPRISVSTFRHFWPWVSRRTASSPERDFGLLDRRSGFLETWWASHADAVASWRRFGERKEDQVDLINFRQSITRNMIHLPTRLRERTALFLLRFTAYVHRKS